MSTLSLLLLVTSTLLLPKNVGSGGAVLGGHGRLLSVSAARPGTPPDEMGGVTFKNFNGANGLLGRSATQPLGLGWFRDCIGLGTIEPQKGKWDWATTDQRVNTAHAQGAEYLPCLLGTGWASTVSTGFGAAKNPPDWEGFVEQFVAHYSAPPFNLRYFEIWNEPTRQAGFWAGTSQQFVDQIYLPAAKIVRRHQCFVVLGGWPSSNSVQELNQVLNYQNAWQWTDIVNLHYRDVSSWQQVYNEWVKTGKCRGIWQTEVGWNAVPRKLPDLYLKSLYWALQAGWSDPNQYKLFWFTISGSGADADKCLLRFEGGKYTPTTNGQRLAVMSDVLSGGSLAPFNQFQMTPALPHSVATDAPAALGFKVGANRTVIAFYLDQATYTKNPALALSIGVTAAPQHTTLVTASGQRQELQGNFSGGTWHVGVPLRPVQADCPTCLFTVAYLELE
ncbi:MAG TPA: hypothetical protein VI455_19370 [Terriglobia bacterium]